MSTLTYAERDLAAGTPSAAKIKQPSIWRRIFDAVSRSQQKRAEREIARYLASHGGVLTDDVEREMMERFSGHRGSL